MQDVDDIRLVLASGVLVKGSTSPVDLLIVADETTPRLKKAIKEIEKRAGRELNYSLMKHEEFYYRLSVRDKFITQILVVNHRVIIDTDAILSRHKEA